MPTKHVDKLIDAYLDGHLLPKERRQVESHIRECPKCARRLFNTERVDRELGPTLRAALGQPSPRPMLRHQVKEALQARQTSNRFFDINWAAPLQFVNAVGTVAVIALLAFGVFVVVTGQIPGVETVSGIRPLGPNNGGGEDFRATTPTPTPQPTAGASARKSTPSLGDTLTLPTQAPEPTHNQAGSAPTPGTSEKVEMALSAQPETDAATRQTTKPQLPGGTIAYALYNPDPGRQTYEIHFINPDGSNPQQFSLDGVSEPALHPANNEFTLAFRAWSEPTSPRSLFSGNLTGEHPQSITDFWEDGQPDWSPTENRIIFASQRESDRRWRLYSVWGDGSLEVNLRREGKSPTFAPDGYRFAFESCDKNGNNCGLWVANLEQSEHESSPILVDSQAKAPDWSPVAEEIVYMANPNGNWDLYLVNSNGNNVRRLTTDPANDGLPVWSPDGKWLAFVSDRGGAWGILLLHMSSGKLHQTTTFEYGTLAPPNQPPYNEHGQRYWWDEQLSWGP